MDQIKEHHTLIVPTRNRPEWLNLSLYMYEQYQYKGTIMIVDDSDDLSLEKNKEIVNNFNTKLKIDHKFYETRHITKSNIRFNFSRYLGFKALKTKYYSTIGDDDFFFPNFAKIGIEFLEHNQDYAAVTGADVKVTYNKNNKFIKKNIKWWKSCHFDDGLDRLLDYCHEASAPYFGVCRTKSLQDIFDIEGKDHQCFVRNKHSDGIAHFDKEIPWVAQVYISGKIGVITNSLNTLRNEYPTLNRDTNFIKAKTMEKNPFVYGPVVSIINSDFTNSVKETYLDLLQLLLKNSKYDKKIIELTLFKIVWRLITRFSFFQDTHNSTSFFKKINKKNKKFNYYKFRYPKLNLSFKGLLEFTNLILKQFINRIFLLKKKLLTFQFNTDISNYLKNKNKFDIKNF